MKKITIPSLILLFFSFLLLSCSIDQKNINEIPAVNAGSVPVLSVDSISLSEDELYTIKGGDNLYNILVKRGFTPNEVYYLSEDIQEKFDLQYLKPGMELYFRKDGSFYFYTDDFRKISLSRSEKENRVDINFLDYRRREIFRKQTVDVSLYDSAAKSGIPLSLMAEIIDYMAFDIDFQRDIDKGSVFSIIYEEFFCDEIQMSEPGEIIFYQIETSGRTFSYYLYEDEQGKKDFFDEDGVSARKNLLRTPIDGAVVTSNFGWRQSPITGFTHKHKGTDFAAPEGSPIYAAGEGFIKDMGYNDMYGNYILVRHINGYDSFYAHLSRFSSRIGVNRNVEQKQIIGYVGSTGMSTGPHCHYELRKDGIQINPALMEQTADRKLEGEELYLFQQLIKSLASSYGIEISCGETQNVW